MEVFDTKSLTQEEVSERLKILRYKVYESEIETIWRQFEKAGFEPILIKGWAASKLYAEPFRRPFTDIDLMIEPSRFDDAVKFSKSLRSNFPVDLHRGCRHY